MNGSSVFLFAALKMKLKMAVRRRLAQARGIAAPDHGPLSPEESHAFDEKLGELFELLEFEPWIWAAARATSARRDDPRSACHLLSYFEERGRALPLGAGPRPD
jgi:hypothetical protein